MLTFLFLVSLTATTLLLLSVAAEEALRVTRAFLTGRSGGGKLRASEATFAQRSEHSIPVNHDSSGLRQLPARPRVAVRNDHDTDRDRIPDRAA